MIGIALDFYRAPFKRFCQKARRDSANRHRGGKEIWLARQHALGRFYVRNDLLRRLNNAAAQACESKRRSHNLYKITAAKAVVPLFDLVRIFFSNKIPKFRRVGVFLDAAPIFLPVLRQYLIA